MAIIVKYIFARLVTPSSNTNRKHSEQKCCKSKGAKSTRDARAGAKCAVTTTASTTTAALLDLGRRVRARRALEAERVLLAVRKRAGVTRHVRGGAVLLADIDVCELEVRGRALVEVEDDRLRDLRRALNVVPARTGDARAVGPVCAERAREVVERELVDVRRVSAGVLGARALVLVIVTRSARK
jgi:hypothetical protein